MEKRRGKREGKERGKGERKGRERGREWRGCVMVCVCARSAHHLRHKQSLPSAVRGL